MNLKKKNKNFKDVLFVDRSHAHRAENSSKDFCVGGLVVVNVKYIVSAAELVTPRNSLCRVDRSRISNWLAAAAVLWRTAAPRAMRYVITEPSGSAAVLGALIPVVTRDRSKRTEKSGTWCDRRSGLQNV